MRGIMAKRMELKRAFNFLNLRAHPTPNVLYSLLSSSAFHQSSNPSEPKIKKIYTNKLQKKREKKGSFSVEDVLTPQPKAAALASLYPQIIPFILSHFTSSMAAFHFSNPFPSPTISLFLFFFLFFKSIHSLSSPSFSLSGFHGDPQFELNVALYGDAAAVGGGGDGGDGAIQLASSSAGRIMYKKPIKLLRGKPWRLMSFSTDFSFSLSQNTGEDGLGFVIVPSSFNVSAFDNGPFGFHFGSEMKQKSNMILVKFTTSSNPVDGDLIKTLVGIDVGYKSNTSLADSGNFSNSSSALIRGQNLHAWIDYQVGSRQLEVRLAENGNNKRPFAPLLSYPIDFSQIWGENKEVVMGLSSSKGNSSTQPCLVYSWSLKVKSIPNWMHSEPLDPKTIAIAKELEPENVVKEEGKNCSMRVVAAMIFGTGCGALTAFVALYLWTIFGNRRPVVPEEFAVQQMVDVKYEKVVVLDKAIEDDGKKVDV